MINLVFLIHLGCVSFNSLSAVLQIKCPGLKNQLNIQKLEVFKPKLYLKSFHTYLITNKRLINTFS